MKSLILLFLLSIGVLPLYSQGLENITVEKYYVSNADDSAASVGLLPVGSVTYRIFVDMAPSCKFQSAYGNSDHPLTFATTSAFFNNEDRGDKTPTYTKNQARLNTVMLDSWVSVGSGCVGNLGILKSEDNGVNTIINSDGILQNNDSAAGIPLTQQDGLIAGTPQNVITLGLDADLEVLNATSQAGNIFTTSNGAWASLYGSHGPTASNRVLIAQITTKGVFSFKFCIQIKDTITNAIEQYVYGNPLGSEILFPELNYSSNNPPHIYISSPAEGQNFLTGQVIPVQTVVSDIDGNVKKVLFYADGILTGSDTVAPFTFNYPTVYGDHVLSCTAIDDMNDSTVSNPVTIHVGATVINNPVSSPLMLNVYPIPSGNYAVVEIHTTETFKTAELELLGMSGNKLLHIDVPQFSGDFIQNIDLSPYASGPYILKFNAGNLSDSIIISKR